MSVAALPSGMLGARSRLRPLGGVRVVLIVIIIIIIMIMMMIMIKITIIIIMANVDAPAHRSPGWHLWQVPATPKPRVDNTL